MQSKAPRKKFNVKKTFNKKEESTEINYKKKAQLNRYQLGTKVLVFGPSKDDIEISLKIFKRKMKDSGKLIEYNDRMQYVKKSEVRRKVLLNAKRSIKNEKIRIKTDDQGRT